MVEKILTAAAAVAAILGFFLEVWREWKARKDDGGKRKRR